MRTRRTLGKRKDLEQDQPMVLTAWWSLCASPRKGRKISVGWVSRMALAMP
ncbi:MAG: hypothetical protein V3V56_08235 [bacterium]